MAYDLTTLRRMDGMPGQQLFLYRTADAAATVAASGYFNDAVDDCNLTTGDVILAVTGYGGTQALSAYVADVASGVVSTTALS